MFFGLLYSPAYPLGTRLGITVYWNPASSQDYFLDGTFRQCLVLTQWLILWFYTQKIYFSAFETVDIARTKLLLSLSYIGVPRTIWRRRRKFGRKKKKIRRLFFCRLNQKATVARTAELVTAHFAGSPSLRSKDFWFRFKNFPAYYTINQDRRAFAKTRFMHKWGSFLQRHHLYLKRIQSDFLYRLLTDFYKDTRFLSVKKYKGPKKSTKAQLIRFSRSSGLLKRRRFYYRMSFNNDHFRHIWLSRFFCKRREYYKKVLYSRFRRSGLTIRGRLLNLRFFWYLKLCCERYFRRHISLSCTNLYLTYFQTNVLSRLTLKEKPLIRRYILALKKRRQVFVTRFRRQATDLSFRPTQPITRNKFSYAQTVLFLSLSPLWRKLVNTYALCYLVIVSALLKNIQTIAQWLYNLVSLGTTRRFRLMRMRFFMLAAKLLRDYAVFGHYLKGFRIEVFGKTGRSQKTRTRFFGDTSGLQFYQLSFRMKYQAFDIPTFAGVLGIRFWIF